MGVVAVRGFVRYIRHSRMANMRKYRAITSMQRPKSNPQIILRPQDLVVLLRLSMGQGPAPTYAVLGAELGLTASESHASIERAVAAQLARKDAAGKPTVIRDALRSFVLHGARYSFPATRGGMTRGVPTAHAAAPLKDQIVADSEPAPVWPYKNGNVRGVAFYPLYPSVPEAAARNPPLGELLALFDALRGGSARERALAQGMLTESLRT